MNGSKDNPASVFDALMGTGMQAARSFCDNNDRFDDLHHIYGIMGGNPKCGIRIIFSSVNGK